MIRTVASQAKADAFVGKLAALGYAVRPMRGRGQVYVINGKAVDVRCCRRIDLLQACLQLDLQPFHRRSRCMRKHSAR